MAEDSLMIDMLRQEQSMARNAVQAGIATNPDDAARAFSLSRSNGVQPGAVLADLDGYEEAHKRKLATELIRNNFYLQNYVNAHPLNAAVSNDDYGHLDEASDHLKALAAPAPFDKAITSVGDWLKSNTIQEGVERGFGDAPISGQFLKNEPSGMDPLAEATLRATVSVPEVALRSLNALIYGAAFGAGGPETGEKLAQALTDPGLQATLIGMGPPGAALAGVMHALGKIPLGKAASRSRAESPRDILAEHVNGPEPSTEGPTAEGIQANAGKIQEIVAAAGPYLREGEVPPAGIHAEIDAIKATQNATDVSLLDHALQSALKSGTRERAPEKYAEFVGMHGDQEIGVDARAVAKLYGDKPPGLGEGLLDFVPAIADKLAIAKATGSDVQIALSDWLSRVTPEVAKQLEPDIRVRPEGITATEAAEAKPYTAKPAGTIGESVANSIGVALEPKRFPRLEDIQARHRAGKVEETLSNSVLGKTLAVGEAQLEQLNRETQARAAEAGKVADSRVATDKLVKSAFENMPLKGVYSDRLLAAAAKAHREALTATDPTARFHAAEQRELSASFAKEALAIEKAQADLGKTADRFIDKATAGVDQEFTNYIHDLLQQAGYLLRQVPDEIAADIAAKGYTSLDAFVSEKSADGWDLKVTDALRSGRTKPLSQMTVGEFRAFKDAIDSLAYVGEAVNKILVEGEKVDFAQWRAGVVDNIKQLPKRSKTFQGNWLYGLDATLTKMEEIIKDLDLRKELGPLFNAIIRPLSVAKDVEQRMVNKLVEDLKQIRVDTGKAWRKTLADPIPNDFIRDPYEDGVPFDMSRENLIQIMLNWGTREGKDAFTSAYGSADLGRKATKAEAKVFEAKVQSMMDQHATAKDWQYVQSMLDIFNGWQKDIDKVARATSGVTSRYTPAEAITTPHGSYPGGFYPIILDKLRSRSRAKTSDALFSPNYFRSTTSKEAGFANFIDFNSSIDSLGTRMQQIIHDIAFREAIKDIGKIIRDDEISETIKKHYGTEYEAQLEPWLKRVANSHTQDEPAIKWANDFMRWTRLSLVNHVLPFNLKVILSPDVGAISPALAAKYLRNKSYYDSLAAEFSKEIPHTIVNLDRDYKQALETTIAKQGWSGVQAEAVRFGYAPISKISRYLRTMTWVGKFEEAVASGRSKPDAAAIADSHVRTRHGSQNIVDLPSIMASNEFLKSMTMFYGYFNTMYNWQRQIPGNLRRGESKQAWTAFYGTTVVGAALGAVLFNQKKESDSAGLTLTKALALQVAGTVPFLRDFANWAIEGFPNTGPSGSLWRAMSQAYFDAQHFVQGKPVKKPITHGANVIGMGTRMPLAQVGRSTQFGVDVMQGKQHPRNFGEWFNGVVTGEARLKP